VNSADHELRLALLFSRPVRGGLPDPFWLSILADCGYVAGGVDDWLTREMAARVSDPREFDRQITAHMVADPAGRRPFVLFDADGNRITGNPATLPSPLPGMDRVFDFALPRDGEPVPFRGILHRLPSGDIFMVAQDMRDSREFRDVLLGAMASGGLLVLVSGLPAPPLLGLAHSVGSTGSLGRSSASSTAI